jgi:hypothetical protein
VSAGDKGSRYAQLAALANEAAASAKQIGKVDPATEAGRPDPAAEAGPPDAGDPQEAEAGTDAKPAPETYVAQLAPPTFSPPGGSFPGLTSVVIVAPIPTCVVYYTTNGTTPGPDSVVYTGPIQVVKSETIRAYVSAPGYEDSPVASASYVVTP